MAWTISKPLDYMCIAACVAGQHTDCCHYCSCIPVKSAIVIPTLKLCSVKSKLCGAC